METLFQQEDEQQTIAPDLAAIETDQQPIALPTSLVSRRARNSP
jgi:hypothetical protein